MTLDGTRFYMVYESTGIQNWIDGGPCPAEHRQCRLNQLWFRTMQIVAGLVTGLARHRPAHVCAGTAPPCTSQTPRFCTVTCCSRSCPERGRRFPAAGCPKAPGGLCQPEHRTAAGPDDEEKCARISARWPCCTRRTPRRTKNYLEGLPAGSSANGTRSMSIKRPGSVAGSINRHRQRGRGPNEAHPGVVGPHRRQTGESGPLGCRGGRRNRQPRQEHLPFQYVPRHPHPDECNHRLHHTGGQQHRTTRTA